MFGWLGSWFGRGWAGITDLANAVRDAIANALNQLIGQFVGWVNAARYFVMSCAYAWRGLVALVVSLANFARRVLFVAIPTAAANALNQASRYAEWLVGQAAQLAWILYSDALNFAIGLANDVRAWALAQLSAIIGRLNSVIVLLNTVARLVLALLTNPSTMADWIAGSIVQAVYRWALGRAELLARWAFNGAVTGALRFVDVAERIITDMFL